MIRENVLGLFSAMFHQSNFRKVKFMFLFQVEM